jgi:hypothetical protein
LLFHLAPRLPIVKGLAARSESHTLAFTGDGRWLILGNRGHSPTAIDLQKLREDLAALGLPADGL